MRQSKLALTTLSALFLSFTFSGVQTVYAEKTMTDEKLAVKQVASDTNKDGKPDRWEYYEEGVLVRVEADSNFDGKIDETGIVENGKIVKVEKDSDYDGKVDKWISY